MAAVIIKKKDVDRLGKESLLCANLRLNGNSRFLEHQVQVFVLC